jgi:hypothetical protein
LVYKDKKMKTTLKTFTTLGLVTAFGVMMGIATTARALDKYQDRKGLFFGMGVGGGGAFRVPSGNMGGEGIFDFQLGAGATSNLTLSLDTDIAVLGFENEVDLSIVPGPEVSYFFGKTGLFVRGGLGAALNVVWIGGNGEFVAGFDVDAGFGWEFFVNSNFALGIALETGYTVRQDDDNVMVGFMMGFKVY